MKKTTVFCIAIVAAVAMMAGGALDIVRADELYVFTNKSVPDNTLSAAELKNIFLGKKVRWADNQRVDCVMLKDSTCQESFLNQHIRKTSFQFNNYWKKQIFTGKGQPPRAFDSEQALINYVAQTSGAIGFSCSRPSGAGVKVVAISP
jgi:ABC-type phosphate transport system substrate-binding protein